MATPGENFDRLLAFCQEVNPPSMTHWHESRMHSVTEEGLKLIPNVDQLQRKRVLIVGCGSGYEVSVAQQMGMIATGLTFLTQENDGASDTWKDHIVYGDMHAMPFDTGSFDFVYSKETLEHSPCPILALMEMNRVLKMEGEFFHLIADGWNKQRDPYHWSCLPDWLWCDLMLKAYFKVERMFSVEPNTDRCAFNNKAYHGRKFRNRSIDEPAIQYRSNIGFSSSYGQGEG